MIDEQIQKLNHYQDWSLRTKPSFLSASCRPDEPPPTGTSPRSPAWLSLSDSHIASSYIFFLIERRKLSCR